MESIKNYVLDEFYKIISENKINLFNKIASDRTRYIAVLLENIYQEHNASAILRSCDCFGVQDLFLLENNTKFKIQRDIALGSGRWVDIHQLKYSENSIESSLEFLKQKNFQLVATSPHSNENIEQVDLSKPTIFMFGTERRGLSPALINNADKLIKIPMYGFTESFNVSVSVALLLQQVRQMLEKSNFSWKLTENEKINLKIEWCKKILNGGVELEKKFIKDFETKNYNCI